ncbi:hypothetical protein CF319_g7387 [Tilletia indica]|nr:hypothetical protein CF319_g7387 [Tilletia indica]
MRFKTVYAKSQYQVGSLTLPETQHPLDTGLINNARIDQTIQRGPARALDALSRDCSTLVSDGMRSIGDGRLLADPGSRLRDGQGSGNSGGLRRKRPTLSESGHFGI